jgi:hypothetical protein
MAYREPKDIQDGTWGAILCIDPHGVRFGKNYDLGVGADWGSMDDDERMYDVTPGPHYYLLDTLQIFPGLTDRSGYFVATINDNKMDIDSYTTYTTITEYAYGHSWGVYTTPYYADQADAIADRQAWLSANPSYPNSWYFHTREVSVPVGDSKSITREYDWTLFHPSSEYVFPNDEFWVGVQEGALENGLDNTWAEGSGGRQWLMGGYINVREYIHEGMKIIGNLHGSDYTELWRTQPIGTMDKPRPLEDAEVDLAQLAAIILIDVNDLQPGETGYYDGGWQTHTDTYGWKFTPHPDYFPKFTMCTVNVLQYQNVVTVEDSSQLDYGAARIWDDQHPNGESITINYISGNTVGWSGYLEQEDGYLSSENSAIMMESEFVGKTWTRDIKLQYAFDLMAAMCEQADYEWQIMVVPGGATAADCRQVCFYPRGTGSPTNPPSIRFETNVRSCPQIQTGDTGELVTDLITLNGVEETIPRFTSALSVPEVWDEVQVTARKYGPLSCPLPPNSYTGEVGDPTLVIDDEGYPAVNFQRHKNSSLFFTAMRYYTDPDTGKPRSLFNMNIDLRKWRRLKFKVRHATNSSGGGDEYKIWLCTQPHPQAQASDWYKSAFIYNYTSQVSGRGWNQVEIELPQCDSDGTVIDWKGWTDYSPGAGPAIADVTADPTGIDFMILEANLGVEPTPWYVTTRPLTDSVSAGEYYLKINNPEHYFLYGTGVDLIGGEVVFSYPKPVAYLVSEQVVIDAISIDNDYPDGYNIRLTHPVQQNYISGQSLHLVGGHSISYSQIHFEKNTFVEYAKSSIIPTHLQYPKRYRVSGHTDIELVEEAKNSAEHEAMVLGRSQKYLQITIDGDPRYLPGYLCMAGLDYDRWSDGETDLIFHNVNMMIDQAVFVVDGVDFYITLSLSSLSSRNFESTTEAVRSLLVNDSKTYVRELK